jgi:hypothetical protein
MFRSTTPGTADMSAKTFAEYNQQLYYNDDLPEDTFCPLNADENEKVTAEEV